MLDMNDPQMAGWNLALRFGLELAALAGFAVAAWYFSSGPMRWVAVTAVPLFVAIIWGAFNVRDDPSRSGKAPIEVGGRVRLAIELLVLVGGALAFALAGRIPVSVGLSVLIFAHYATSVSRIKWLIRA